MKYNNNNNNKKFKEINLLKIHRNIYQLFWEKRIEFINKINV